MLSAFVELSLFVFLVGISIHHYWFGDGVRILSGGFHTSEVDFDIYLGRRISHIYCISWTARTPIFERTDFTNMFTFGIVEIECFSVGNAHIIMADPNGGEGGQSGHSPLGYATAIAV